MGYLHRVEEAISLLLAIEYHTDEYSSVLAELRGQCDEQTMARLYAAKKPTLHELTMSAQASLRSALAKTQTQAESNWGLTNREIEVVQAVVDGLRRQDIAKRLVISEKTVDNHLSNIANKLNLDGKRMREVISWALQNGFKRR